MSTVDSRSLPAIPQAPAVVLQIAGLLAANHLLTRLATRLIPDVGSSRIGADWARFGEASAGDLGQAIVTLAIVPGVFEELIFRGALFALILRLGGVRWAIGVSAVAFGAVHLDLHLGTIAALLGLQLACLRHAYGLGLAIAAHVANNVLVLLLRFRDEALPERVAAAGDAAIDAAFGALSFGLALAVAGIAWASLARAMRSPKTPAEMTPGPADRTTDPH